MNGPCAMYTVRKIHDSPEEITLPTCMYRMQNIHSTSENADLKIKKQSAKDVEILEQRQERILHQLEELKLQLQSIRNSNRIPVLPKSVCLAENLPKSAATMSLQNSVSAPFELQQMQDIVISANPKHPPLSIKVLCNMLKDNFSIGTNCHIHSTITEASPKLINFFRPSKSLSRTDHQLMVTLIWKNIEDVDPIMMINPLTQTAIKGEVNIIRYLIYLIPKLIKSYDPVYLTEMDYLLDLLHGSLLHGNNKEIQSVLHHFNTILGKSSWLMGNALSIIDMVAWSILHQTQAVSSSQGNIKNWLSNCSNHPFFQDVLDYIHCL